MAQARGTPSTRAVDSLSDSNPTVLTDDMEIVKRDDGAVILKTKRVHGEHEQIHERRCDSAGDLDHMHKGGKLWYSKLLEQQKRRDTEAAKPKRKSKEA